MKKMDFGMELVLDLHDCIPAIINNRNDIARYAKELCEIIKMKPFGDPQVPFFGEQSKLTAGHSVLQFIETSSITVHFCEYKKTAYINIFSCKWFDKKLARDFTRRFFGCRKIKSRLIVR